MYTGDTEFLTRFVKMCSFLTLQMALLYSSSAIFS